MKNINKADDITVIIPVHELNNVTEQLFKKALESVKTQLVVPDLMVVTTPDLAEKVKKIVGQSGVVEINEGKSDFASQLNFGVAKVKTEWFILLEFDDILLPTWVKNVIKYKTQYDDVDMFLPIITEVNTDNAFLGTTNEAVWANQFSDEIGILDSNALLGYQNFNFDGMAMKKETYEANGGLKSSIKLTFIYEFLLRMSYLSARIMVIPKIGYKHVNQRDGSIFHEYKQTLTADESRWWMSLAKKEYFHTKDRGLTYDKESV